MRATHEAASLEQDMSTSRRGESITKITRAPAGRRKRGAVSHSIEAESNLRTFRTLPTFRLHVLARVSERFFEQYYQREFGNSLLECRMIGITGDFGQLSFKRLCETANLDKSHASRLIDRLIKRRLLHKVSHPSDQRSVMLGLTASGRQCHRALHASARTLADRWLSALTRDARRVFQESLVKLVEQMRVMNDEERGTKGRTLKRPDAVNPDAEAALREVIVDRRMATQLYDLLGSALGKKRKT
jgi:DNA-binding MarR family transcriptional regulator